MSKRRPEGVELVTKWEVPKELYEPLGDDKHDARILTMPNIPRPLHGEGCQPRTILGKSTWDHMRKLCYFMADYKCEACGCVPERGKLHAHELFEVNWSEGYSKFIRCVALCEKCHIRGIHSGRMLTLYKQGNPLMTKSKVLDGIDNLLANVSQWNKEHPKSEPLRVYATILDALRYDEIADDVARMIDKYGVGFYAEDEKRLAKWRDWRVIIGNKEYPTPYASYQDWENKMEERNAVDDRAKAVDPFTDPVYNELKQILAQKS